MTIISTYLTILEILFSSKLDSLLLLILLVFAKLEVVNLKLTGFRSFCKLLKIFELLLEEAKVAAAICL